jgi:septal ring factor EnvC (AmiA/AmiB activator)
MKPLATDAQNGRQIRRDRQDVRQDRRELNRDNRDIRHNRRELAGDRRELNQDIRAGRTNEVRQDRSWPATGASCARTFGIDATIGAIFARISASCLATSGVGSRRQDLPPDSRE